MIAKLELSIDQNHKLTNEIISLQEQERKSLARDLHDEFGQCLTAISTDAKIILKFAETKYPELKESANAISQLSRHLTDIVSGLLKKLRPGLLDDFGIEAAINDLIETWKIRHPEIECEVKILPVNLEIEESKAITLYRSIQECLTNISKHAKARIVNIELMSLSKNRQEGIQLIVKDDGNGFQLENLNGFGLLGMRERIEGLNGDLFIKTKLGAGTEINAWIPIKA